LKREDILPGNIPILTEQLKRNGFETIALSSIGHISPDFGFGRGFDHFIQLYKEERLIEKGRFLKANNTPTPASEDINEILFPLLQENRKKDTFILIWSADTHSPYFHRDEKMARFCPPSHQIVRLKDIERMRTGDEISRVKALYEDMIYYNDHYLGMLIEKLKESSLFDRPFHPDRRSWRSLRRAWIFQPR
jgi:arylsulfatase A-like enzyme